MPDSWLCQEVERLTTKVTSLELNLNRFGMNLGRNPLLRGSTWEVSDTHIASWHPGTSIPFSTSSEYARFYNGNLEIRGGALDISTAADGARMEMTGEYLKTWNSGGTNTFYLDFTTGDLLMTGTFYVPNNYRFNESGLFVELKGVGNNAALTFVEDVDASPLGEVAGILYQSSGLGSSDLYLSSAGTTTNTDAQVVITAYDTSDDTYWLFLNTDTQTIGFYMMESSVLYTPLKLTTNTVNVGGDGYTTTVNGVAVFNEDSADVDFRVESDDNANMLFVDGGEDRVGIGTATPTATLDVVGSVQLSGNLLMPTPGQIRQEVVGTNATRYGKIVALIRKQLVDNSATAVFTITTAGDGSTDSGCYSCKVHAVAHQALSSVGAYAASKLFTAQFAHATKADGTGADSAVSEVIETASAATNSANKDIGTVTMTVSTTAYVTTVLFTVDSTGTNATAPIVTVDVEIVWGTYVTAPVLAVA